MQLTETAEFPTRTLSARADALMERMIARGMNALVPDDYETVYQALEAACEIEKTEAAVPLVRDWRTEMRAGISIYMHARYEHAWLLRAEGLTFAAIGRRMGCSHQAARHAVYECSKSVSWAMRRARITVYRGTRHAVYL